MQKLRKPEAQIILALDVDTIEEALGFVDRLFPLIKIYKVGSQLFTAYGPKIIEMLHKKGAEVFLDLKYFDIPNTVAKAVAAATRQKVKMLTLHISGGKEMIKAAVLSAKAQGKAINVARPLLIGVTVLTSSAAKSKDVLLLAKKGIDGGLDGIVCSAREGSLLRKKIKKDFLIVTPAIRPNKAVADDQRRTATLGQAVEAGSNFLVIGRPILISNDPLKMTEEILGDLSRFAGCH